LSDQVDDGQAALASRATQTAAELLREDGGRRRRPQQQNAVDDGDVDPLPEHLNREHTADPTGLEVAESLLPNITGVISGEHDALQASFGELPRHVARMLFGHTEAECAHPAGIEHDPLDRLEQLCDAQVIVSEEVAQLLRRIAASTPRQRPEIGAVGNAEVLERHKEALVDRLPET